MSPGSVWGCLSLVVVSWGCGSGDRVQRADPAPSDSLIRFVPELNVCPVIRGAVVIPLEIAPLATAHVAAYAINLDASESELFYSWTSESGTFADSAAAVTEYQCSALGPQLLEVSARDASGCSGHLSVQVECIASP